MKVLMASMAMKAAPEHTAYVALLNVGKSGKRDVLASGWNLSGLAWIILRGDWGKPWQRPTLFALWHTDGWSSLTLALLQHLSFVIGRIRLHRRSASIGVEIQKRGQVPLTPLAPLCVLAHQFSIPSFPGAIGLFPMEYLAGRLAILLDHSRPQTARALNTSELKS
jgi:hypothetical protein